MAKVIGYHRPSSLDEAVAKLGEPGIPKVVMGGGTVVNDATDRTEVEVVDLQALGLDSIAVGGGRMSLGSGVTLQELADHPDTPGGVATLARREAPNTIRSVATIGGLVGAGDTESELLAAFLVADAVVEVASAGSTAEMPLSDALSADLSGSIITGLSFATEGDTVSDHTVRTPADRPICAVVGRKAGGSVILAACGAASTPVLFDDPSELSPVADFRGSIEYRSHLISVHAARVREALA
ncbi:MAG: FAD binding domain-containing protein [Acidimicrobiia bacterium]|nr:FAD binding domain-containing protein [Acidimicrobiia bacterium]